MAEPISAGASALASIGAGILSYRSAKDAAKQQKRQQAFLNRLAQESFTPIQVFGPGGSGTNFGGAPAGTFQAGGIDFNSLANLGQQGGGPVSAGQFGPPGAQGQFFPSVEDALAGGLGRVNTDDSPNVNELGNINLNLGDLDPAGAALRQLASQSIGQAGLAGQGIDPAVLQNFQNFQQAGTQFGNPGFGTLNSLLGGTGQAFGNQLQGLIGQQTDPFQQGLANSLFSGAQQSLDGLPGTQEQARAQQLSLLRQEAAPFEERAFSGLQDNLFAQGRLGSTGGALQTEAFARGLGQADLSRQLAAGQEGRNAQGAQLGLAQGQLNSGNDISALQDQLLQGATNRFQGISQLASGLSAQRFNTGQALSQDRFGRSSELLNQSFAPQQLQQVLQQGFLNNANLGLGANAALTDQARANAALGLGAIQAQSNSRLGGVAGSSVAPQDLSTSTAFAQLAGALAPGGGRGAVGTIAGGIGSLFGGLFGGGGSNQVAGVSAPIGANQNGTNNRAARRPGG